MKFGKELESKIEPEWRFHYLDYKYLKHLLSERTNSGTFFAEADEAQFVEALEQEIQKVDN